MRIKPLRQTGTIVSHLHSRAVTRYYFDLRDDDTLVPDEEGLEISDIELVQEEAARSLVDMARFAISGRPIFRMAIEVRDETGPVLEVSFRWKISRFS